MIDIHSLYATLRFLKVGDIQNLAQTSPRIAYYVAECLIWYQNARRAQLPFRLSFFVFNCAGFAFGESVHSTLDQFHFVPRLSRTCRSCGKCTQRKVFQYLLCAKCTRNPAFKCWMVPAKYARGCALRVHSGPRGGLVFASDVVAATSFTRAKLRALMGLKVMPSLRRFRATT